MAIRFRYLALLLIVFALMILLGSLPGQADALSARFGDKALHLIAYICFSVLCYRVWNVPRRQRILLTIMMIALLGLIDEGIQAALPYRNASVVDWCFDLLAALIAVSGIWLQESLSPLQNSHAKNQ
jgi:VanZ family protein